MDVYVISRQIGTIKIDVTNEETHDSTMRVTDNPIESGAVIADHAALEPRKLKISGLMVDWLASGVNIAPSSSIAPRANPDFLDDMALPPGVQSFTNETQFQLLRLGSPADYAPTVQVLTNQLRPLAPWLPNFAPAGTLDLSSGTKRVEQVYDQLRAVQKSADPVSIVTGSQHYENMLLLAVSMTQHWDGSAELSIQAQEIFIVDTRKVSGISVKGGAAKMSGRSAHQAMNTQDKGNVQLGEVDTTKRSVLGRWFGQ